MNAVKKSPESVAVDLPAQDGTLLRLTMHLEEKSGRFGYDSLLEVQEHTPHGLRPLVSYRAGSVIHAPREKGLTLHDQIPGLTIGGHWLIHLSDWIDMMTEESIDIWKADAS